MEKRPHEGVASEVTVKSHNMATVVRPRPPRQHDCGTASETSAQPVPVRHEYGNRQDTKSSTVTKRKRQPNSDVARAYKKIRSDSPSTGRSVCPLLRVVQQYGLLLSIVLNLSPEDLLALALSAKALHEAIAPRLRSLQNLLERMPCPGRGIQIRERRHQISGNPDSCLGTQYVVCASTSTSQSVETRPCVQCRVNTCDECRIHCVYQSIYEAPVEEDELPNFSGFVMLDAPEVPILSPNHLNAHGAPWQDPSQQKVAPYHDSGFIDLPFDEQEYGPPECVESILSVDLGEDSLALSVPSNVSSPSPVLRAFHNTALQRRRWFCRDCLPQQAITRKRNGAQDDSCHCTLQSRFLDRWLCLRCYEKEEDAIANRFPANKTSCGCGCRFGRAMCTWCWGEIRGPDGQ